jgi:hypothetical protein
LAAEALFGLAKGGLKVLPRRAVKEGSAASALGDVLEELEWVVLLLFHLLLDGFLNLGKIPIIFTLFFLIASSNLFSPPDNPDQVPSILLYSRQGILGRKERVFLRRVGQLRRGHRGRGRQHERRVHAPHREH